MKSLARKNEGYIISLVCDDITMTVGFYYLLTFTLSKYKKFYPIISEFTRPKKEQYIYFIFFVVSSFAK